MKRDRIFICYSHRDVRVFRELKEHLQPLEAQGTLDIWDDTRIDLGSDWHTEIQQALLNAKVAVLLISQAFLASDYIRGHELPLLLERAQQKGVTIVPVFVRPSTVKGATYVFTDPVTGRQRDLALTVFQGLNGPERTLAEMDAPKRARVLATLAEKLAELRATERLHQKTHSHGTSNPELVLVDLSHHQKGWERLEEFVLEGMGSIEEGPGVTLTRRSMGPVWGSLIPQTLTSESHIDINALSDAAVLVMPLPHHCSLSHEEIERIERWVRRGGGLFLLGFYAADSHHRSNPSSLARVFGFEMGDDLVMPTDATDHDCRAHVFSHTTQFAVNVSAPEGETHPILHEVRGLAFLSSCSIAPIDAPGCFELLCPPTTGIWLSEGPKDSQGWRKIIVKWSLNRHAAVPVLVARDYERGRVVVAGSWKLLTLDFADNHGLVKNVLAWLSRRPVSRNE
jgi:hypothetical protein